MEVTAAGDTAAMDDLLKTAYSLHPDLAQAGLQLANSQIGLKGSNNNRRPELDLVGIPENNGLAGTPYAPAGPAYPGFVGGYGTVLDQLLTRKLD
ncbi:MAG: hypothetical protein ACRD5L_09295 [Bryobacteraceae bacterium]